MAWHIFDTMHHYNIKYNAILSRIGLTDYFDDEKVTFIAIISIELIDF